MAVKFKQVKQVEHEPGFKANIDLEIGRFTVERCEVYRIWGLELSRAQRSRPGPRM